MLSKVLPPSTQTTGVTAPQREPLVPSVWPGVYVPNFSDWREGDVVLIHRAMDTVGIGIQMAQASSLNALTRAGSICSHAAIYVGGGMVVDATKGLAVSEQSVWNYCQTRAIQLRRITDPAIPASDIADIALFARQHVGEPYSVIQAIVSKLVPGTVPARDALYCSTLVGLVVADATGFDLSSDPAHQPLHPGTLVAHPDLTDILLE